VLNFLQLDLEFQQSCDFDNVTVFDGFDFSSPKLGTFCGNRGDTIPLQISTGRVMTVLFLSDRSENARGKEKSRITVVLQYCSRIRVLEYFLANKQTVRHVFKHTLI